MQKHFKKPTPTDAFICEDNSEPKTTTNKEML